MPEVTGHFEKAVKANPQYDALIQMIFETHLETAIATVEKAGDQLKRYLPDYKVSYMMPLYAGDVAGYPEEKNRYSELFRMVKGALLLARRLAGIKTDHNEFLAEAETLTNKIWDAGINRSVNAWHAKNPGKHLAVQLLKVPDRRDPSKIYIRNYYAVIEGFKGVKPREIPKLETMAEADFAAGIQ